MTLPTSTYRLQFRTGTTFDTALALIPYLKRLGVSHLYASPIFKAVAGSTHGYDVADCNEIDPDLGGRDGFSRMAAALEQADIGLILDIVPNHMAASLENPWWRSVIEWGQASPYSRHFDIDWSRKLTLPVLAGSLDRAFAQGELKIVVDEINGNLALAHGDSLYPLAPASYALVLAGIESPAIAALKWLAEKAQAGAADTFHAAVRDGLAACDRAGLRGLLQRVSRDSDRLRRICAIQPYLLMDWRQAANGLSYRRFFDVTGLVGLRVEDRTVFDDSHATILDLVARGEVQGLRIDHIDGLAGPKAYFDRLREKTGPDTLLLVEKILGPDERLPAEWPVSGTTGYEFIAALGDVLTDAAGSAALRQEYQAIGEHQQSIADDLRTAKSLMVDRNFAGETAALLSLGCELCAMRPETRDIDRNDLGKTLREMLIAFPVYRSYIDEDGPGPADRQLLADLIAVVSARPGAAKPRALKFFGDLLLGQLSMLPREKVAAFRRRFQQLTGPLLAKSAEDTLFYRDSALLAANEVGGDLDQPAGGLNAFHRQMARRLDEQPAGLSATSTHDTKRGEDARARLFSLTEAPEVFAAAVERWRAMNSRAISQLSDGVAPEPAVEWMIYQALCGHWPPGMAPDDVAGLRQLQSRLSAFLQKAMREAKQRSDWAKVNEAYESAVISYGERLLGSGNQVFLRDFCQTIAPFVRAGLLNSLTQTLAKLTAPGIPDIYQGSESHDFSFVDPDNRRTPDFAALAAGLDDEGQYLPFENDRALFDGTLKQRLVARCLALRTAEPELFSHGTYQSLEVVGKRRKHLLAFVRKTADAAVIVIATRLNMNLIAGDSGQDLTDFWGDTAILLPAELRNKQVADCLKERDFHTGEAIAVSNLLANQTVSLLLWKRALK
ncbi:MAG: malto-oligosyltrehalose synthase [Allorhizobium sp.]